MRVEELKLTAAPFLEDYLKGEARAADFFDYKNPFDKQEWMKRQDELKLHTFPRKELTEYLLSFNDSIGSSSKAIDSIHKLNNPDSLAVVGGQQAGLLTGPLLVIYKCISTIQLAKQAEKELGVPVVPVFWIAGEDHDMDEINHVMVPKNDTAKKLPLKAARAVKTSASLWKWKPDDVKPWLKEVFRSFGETAFTQDFLVETERILERSDSIVSFFAKLLAKWFSNEGLILLDSGDPAFKKLQTVYLQKMITENAEIDKAFQKQSKKLNRKGYSDPIEVQQDNAHLFYTFHDERMLLFRTETGYTSKNFEFSISESDLLLAAEHMPERFSNNVVTRPLMQEFLLPTLSFVAGPGEVSYWATLGEVFSHFGRRIPVLMPRISITLVPEKTSALLESKGIKASQVIENGTENYKRAWYEKNRPVETSEQIGTFKADLKKSYSKLEALAEEINDDLIQVTEKNLNRILGEIDYLEHKMEQRIRRKVKVPLAEFDEVGLDLKPAGILQERVWNLYQFANITGPELVEKLLEYPFSFNEKHKIVYL